MKTLIKSTLTLALVSALTACGSGGGSDSGSNNGGNPVTKSSSLTGKAIDGYITGAKVYLDMNYNGRFDSGEPSAVTTEGGNFDLKLEGDQVGCELLVPVGLEVPVGAWDEDFGTVTTAYELMHPPMFAVGKHKIDIPNVTPLTTATWMAKATDFVTYDCEALQRDEAYKQQAFDNMQGAIVQGEENLVQFYGISEERVYSDFVEKGDQEAYDKAVKIREALQKSYIETEELAESYPQHVIVNIEYRIDDYYHNDDPKWYKFTIIEQAEFNNVKVETVDEVTLDVLELVNETITHVNTKENQDRFETSVGFFIDGDGIGSCSKSEAITANGYTTHTEQREVTSIDPETGEEVIELQDFEVTDSIDSYHLYSQQLQAGSSLADCQAIDLTTAEYFDFNVNRDMFPINSKLQANFQFNGAYNLGVLANHLNNGSVDNVDFEAFLTDAKSLDSGWESNDSLGADNWNKTFNDNGNELTKNSSN